MLSGVESISDPSRLALPSRPLHSHSHSHFYKFYLRRLSVCACRTPLSLLATPLYFLQLPLAES